MEGREVVGGSSSFFRGGSVVGALLPQKALDRLPFFLKFTTTEKNKKNIIYRGEAAKEPLLLSLEARAQDGTLMFDDLKDATTFQFMFNDTENSRLAALTETLLQGVKTGSKRRSAKGPSSSAAPPAKHKKNKKVQDDDGDGFEDLFA